jgi:hypothetical protein
MLDEDKLQEIEAKFRASWDKLEEHLNQIRVFKRQDGTALLELIQELRGMAYDEWFYVSVEPYHFVLSRSLSNQYPKLYIQVFLMGDKVMVIGHLHRLYPFILNPVALTNELKIMLGLLMFAPLD